jgi:hypothetical protein
VKINESLLQPTPNLFKLLQNSTGMAGVEDQPVSDEERLTKMVVDLWENCMSNDLSTDDRLVQFIQQNDASDNSGNQQMFTSASQDLTTPFTVEAAIASNLADGMELDLPMG